MKRFKILSILAVLIMVFTSALLAQGGGLTPATVIDNPNPPIFDFGSAFSTFASLVMFIPIVVGMFKKVLHEDTTSITVQIFSWTIGIVLTMIGWGLHLGFLDSLTWYIALAYGFAASLAANGVADTGLIQAILALFIPKKTNP